MGVPKFFRYISERYPCLSELVKEYQIPEFDNLYLDMNGIIHMCSHPDDNNPLFRITEEKIFQDVFHYIEVLFRMIRPRKLFFMAIDGVAPRAKMNQQRGRRFRSAKDAEKQEAEVKKRGEKLPDVPRFDSNCITPGTVFMARLHEQLKYFVVDKISHDTTWQTCQVILSGHETPGEGEHKIMDYIRYIRAQPGYDPNTRHCLYGLDADLIMLGLCTHEPHFSLLREEVKFGRKSTKRQSVPEEITFYLLHLSLMREYLELEFSPLKDKLGFKYDFEKIIDDWVLMGFLVGNDFIPNLPNLHIANGALPVLYKAYMDILPTLDGYINEAGSLNLIRFQRFLEKLGDIDIENFEEIRDDIAYMESKTGRKWNAHTKVSTRNLEEWKPDGDNAEVTLEPLEPGSLRDSGMAALIKATNELCEEDEDDDNESQSEDDAFVCFKKDYYRNKLEYEKVTPEVMRDQAEGYVRAIQWNLNYYYNGCCSWSWYYPHHYAPYISDIKGFANLRIEFDYGRPFLPYEQLLAVLPSASKNLLPICYHRLMTHDDSVIKQYYPEEFETDLNGKKQDWEAVVLVPFINEDILIKAMQGCNNELTPEERNRNSHGPMLVYKFTPRDMGLYYAPDYFPPVTHNHTEVEALFYNDIIVPKEKLIKGAYPGAAMNVYYPGFPTMKHLKYKGDLRKAKIRVFESPSRNENMMITIIPKQEFMEDKIPTDLLSTSVFVNWPHLIEAKVVSISNCKWKFIGMGGPNEYNTVDYTGGINQFKQECEGITEYYQKRMGIECGETKVLVQVQQMIGRRYVFRSDGRLCLEKEFTPNISNYPLQTVVFNINAYDAQKSVYKDVGSIFPIGCTCFILANPHYGSQGIVEDNKDDVKIGRIKISIISVLEEPDISSITAAHADVLKKYKLSSHATRKLSITNFLFSRITGSIFITARNNEGGLKNVNIGLDLKFNKKNKETPGYTKKIGTNWHYTDRAVELVRSYSEKYPEVFEYLAHDDRFDEINAESIFKDDWEEKLKELQTWLKSLPTSSIERQTCGSAALEPEVVEELEKILKSPSGKTNEAKKVTMHIMPCFLYRPEIQNGTLVPDPKTETTILDRIVNVRNGFSVPLGLKGTVISIQESTTGSERDTLYDVLFDKPFKDGLKFNCSQARGYRLPSTAFINISYGLRLLEEKTGKPNEIIAGAEASHRQPSMRNNKGPSNFNNLVTQQSKQPPNNWRASQADAQFFPYQTQQPFQKENSAFVQFTNITGQGQQFQSTQYSKPTQPQGFFIDANSKKQQNYNNQQKTQNFPSNSAVPPVRDSNNFMPSFSSSREGAARQSSPQKSAAVTTSKPEASSSRSSSNLRPSVNTDILKTLLKTSNETAEKSSARSNPSSGQIKKAEVEMSQKLTFDMFAEAAKAPASVSLLTYYQSNGLGLPRYQYFNCGNMIQSQITLANGKHIVGKPAKTREDASENVAADVLEIFMKKGTYDGASSQIADDFPIPPKTWVEPHGHGKTHENAKSNKHKEDGRSSSHKRKTDTRVLHNSLVPLQAIKNHIKPSNVCNKQAKDEEDVKENAGSQHGKPEAANGVNRSNQKGQSSSADGSQVKPKRERKTRIVAKFIDKKN